MAENFGEAFFKAQEATKTELPLEGTVLISVSDRDKPEVAEVARGLHELGFRLMATGRTQELIADAGIPVKKIAKINEGRPNILDEMTNQKISMVVNTPVGKKGAVDDSYIRKAAIKYKIPYVTTMAEAKATVEGIRAAKAGKFSVQSLQEFHKNIR